jgi:hypothetical protein
MYIIEGKVVSGELFRRRFVCNLSKCKGACCWEGDFGAPVNKKEIRAMQAAIPELLPLLDKESKDIIAERGVSIFDSEYGGTVAPIKPNGSCVFLTKGNDGVAKCGWEKVYEEGKSDFRKPISCHLYPLRVSKNNNTGWEALNYDEWDICSAACSLGEELKVPAFRFLKEAIIRAYGNSFYDQMEGIYEAYFEKGEEDMAERKV